MSLCGRFLLDISLLTEREVYYKDYSKDNQNKAENIQNWCKALDLRFTTHSVFLIVALRVRKRLATSPIILRMLAF